MRNSKIALALYAVLVIGASGLASAASDASAAAGATASASVTLTSGEIRKIDTDQGKVTIKHDPITNLDMPAMTMVFRAAKPDLLKNIKVGDKIQFRAETVAGGFVVTDIQPGK